MSFASPEFVIFFAVICILYFATPYRLRWVLLLIASYLFYAYWNAWYILLIVFSTFVDFIVAARLHRAEDPRRRKLLLTVSMVVNLGVLFAFKYFNFFSDSAADILQSLGVAYNAATLDVLLPVGISFYTFQSMSYTIDVYRRTIEPERNPGIFATYVAFFPQLVAGPIERAGNIMPQFYRQVDFDYDRIVNGLRRILWGMFKKMVIADHVAMYVNVVYNDVHSFSGPTLWIATVFFAVQIYCDFSAYSDIAVGTAQILGINLMENFRQPYLSRSVREFWRRWHISLSTWFRDYLYIPLGGSRVRFGWVLVNLMIVFVVSGLWHGANWTFAIWGMLHGGYVVAEVVWEWLPFTKRLRAPQWVKIAITFVLVCFAWIFFRANSLGDAWYVVTHLGDIPSGLSLGALASPINLQSADLARLEFMLAWGLLAALILVDWLDARWGLIAVIGRSPLLVRWGIYYALSLAILLSYGSYPQEFIYFQF